MCLVLNQLFQPIQAFVDATDALVNEIEMAHEQLELR